MTSTSQIKGQTHREMTEHVQNHMGTQQRWTQTFNTQPFPAAWGNLRPQNRQRKQAKSQVLRASNLRHAGVYLTLAELLGVIQSPKSQASTPPSLSQTHTQAYRHKGRYVCGYRITQPMKNSLMTETYRDEDGLIKQLRGRVKYVEEKSLLVQNGMGNQCL